MVTAATTTSGSPGSVWMQCPANYEDDVPPGLAFLNPLEQLIVAKRRDNLHDAISQTADAFTIFNSGGQKVYLAVQTRSFKQFDVKIFDNYGNEVIHVQKPFHLCTNKALVWAPPGNLLGTVYEDCRCTRTYVIKNEAGIKLFKIRARGVTRYVLGQSSGVHVYEVCLVSCGGHTIGEMQDQCPVVDADNFGVTFPKEIDVKSKVVLLGACFLIWPLKC